MNPFFIVQARLGSTRLPGKVLKTVLGKTLLDFQIERLSRSKLVKGTVIATTTNPNDDVLEDFCKSRNVLCHRGSENDVLSRYIEAAKKMNADPIVRVTSDCPLIDPQVLDDVVGCYLDNFPKYDFVANTIERTYARGLDCEVVSFKALHTAHQKAKDQACREHVTRYLYLHPEEFNLFNVASKTDSSRYRLTVDTAEDFELIKRILETLYPKDPAFTIDDVVRVLTENPSWEKLNAHIEQKKI